MEVTLLFVPPGGGKPRYQLQFELPGMPQPGDHISITRPGEYGSEDFTVRRTVWNLESAVDRGGSVSGGIRSVSVECVYAEGEQSSASHKNTLREYGSRSGR